MGTSTTGLGAQVAMMDMSGTMYDLNTVLDSSGAGWNLSLAVGINDYGWIVLAFAQCYRSCNGVSNNKQTKPPAVFQRLSGNSGNFGEMSNRSNVVAEIRRARVVAVSSMKRPRGKRRG